MRNRFCKYIIVPILTLMTITLCVFKMSESFGMVDDSIAYVSQAITLTQGTTEKFINDSKFMICKYDLEYMTPTTYHYGFPLTLAPIYRYLDFIFLLLKALE